MPSPQPTQFKPNIANGNGLHTAPATVVKKVTVPPPIPNRPAFLLKKTVPEPEKSADNPQLYSSYKREANSSSPVVYPVPITIRSNTGPAPFPSGDQAIQSRYQTSSPSPVKPSNNNDAPSEDGVDNVRMRLQNRIVLPADDIDKRQSEIYEKLMEERDRLKREAEEEEERRRKEYEEQGWFSNTFVKYLTEFFIERKAHEAEAKIRLVAQRAREQYEKSLRTSDSLLPALNEGKSTSLKEAIKRSRPPKPANREAIVQWFVSTELPKGTGLDPKTKYPARWFHGEL